MKPTFPRIVEIIDTHGLVEIVEEIRLRTWARLNYAAPEERDDTWHPIVLEEMDRNEIASEMGEIFDEEKVRVSGSPPQRANAKKSRRLPLRNRRHF